MYPLGAGEEIHPLKSLDLPQEGLRHGLLHEAPRLVILPLLLLLKVRVGACVLNSDGGVSWDILLNGRASGHGRGCYAHD